MLWVIILHEYKTLSQKPRSRLDRVMLQCAVIAGLIQFALHMMQIPDFALAPHTISKPPPCFTVGVIQGVTAFSLVLHRTETLQFDRKILRFDSSFQRTIYSSLLFNIWVPQPTGAFWHCLGSSTVVFWQQFYHISQLDRVFFSQWILTFFSRHWFSCTVMLGTVILVSRKLLTALVVAFCLPAKHLVLFCLLFWCFLIL